LKGHHIYTRAWFEYGSTAKNAGTYTVELTPGLFRDNRDEAIYRKLNPKCAAVPEALAPRNTEKSLFRIFHPFPDVTVTCRSWFVTDEITGRGTVPYTASLVFQGEDNRRFLLSPAKAFEVSSYEPYGSYIRRVGPDAPAAPSERYDPRDDDYAQHVSFAADVWERALGFDAELFGIYYVSLCRAVAGKAGAKIGVKLPREVDSEKLILATLSVLPMCLKRKFGAASAWTGLMDGAASAAIDGMQLICYYDENPMSDAGYPVIDMTPDRRHRFLGDALPGAGTQGTYPGAYAAWVWDNIGDPAALSGFEKFLNATFKAVIDKMPLEVLSTCFHLWRLFVDERPELTFGRASEAAALITEAFARSVSRFPFLEESLRACLSAVAGELAGGNFKPAHIQAICKLAENGNAQAASLVGPLYERYRKEERWDAVAPILAHFAASLQGESAVGEAAQRAAPFLLDGLKARDEECSSVSQDALLRFAYRLRCAIISQGARSDADIEAYKQVAKALNDAFNAKSKQLPQSFFALPDAASVRPEDWLRLEIFNIRELRYTPTAKQWGPIMPIMARFSERDITQMAKLYWEGVREPERAAYISELDAAQAYEVIGLYVRRPDSLGGIRDAIEQIYSGMFSAAWGAADRDLGEGATWDFIGAWVAKLKAIGFRSGDGVFNAVKLRIAIREPQLRAMARDISEGALEVIGELWGETGNDVADTAALMRAVDFAAADPYDVAREERLYREIVSGRAQAGIARLYSQRLLHWYEREEHPRLEWAVTITAADMLQSNGRFDIDNLLRLREGKRQPTEPPGAAGNLADIIRAMSIVLDRHEKYAEVQGATTRIAGALAREVGEYVSTNPAVFADKSVRREFRALREAIRYDYRESVASLGKKICGALTESGAQVSEGVLSDYATLRRSSSAASSAHSDTSQPITLVATLGALALILAIACVMFLSSGGGFEKVPGVLGAMQSTYIPIAAAALVLVSSVLSVIRAMK
jgi:hypothetical protein